MKLQPVFSWQKYEGEPETQNEQFQYQLQTQHGFVANAVNGTIDDLGFYTKEYQTSFLWLNGLAIWKVTVPVVWASGGLTSTNALPITLAPKQNMTFQTLTVIDMFCVLQNGTTFIPVPYVDTTAFANQISLAIVGLNAVLTAGSNRSAWSGYVTVYYTKG